MTTPTSTPTPDPGALAARLRQWLMFLWRHTAHVVVGTVTAWAVARLGLRIDDATANLLEASLFGLGVAAYGWVQHWLETRRGTGRWARTARFVARLMVLGAPALPTYIPS